MTRITHLCFAAALAIGAVNGTATAQEVGRASAVNPAATSNMRTIVIGESISSKQRIKTEAQGSVQLLFIDKTSMTIGPNSDLVIDEYVYNPSASTGKLAATLSKGALRFVGGQVSHNGQAEIKTASAVIGIRGGVALINGPNVYAGYGSSTVTSGGATVTLGAGEFTQTQGGGAPPTPPGPPPAGFVAAQVATFQSSGGQSGGAPVGAATPARVAQAEARATGSPTGTVAQVPPVVNGTVQVAATTATQNATATTTQQNAIVTTVQQSAQTSTQSTAAVVVAQEIVNQQPQPVRFTAQPFVLTTTNCCATGNPTSPAPFVPGSFASTSTNSFVSNLLGYRPASTGTPATANFFQYGINIIGVGRNQSSWFETATGSLVDDGQGGIALSAGFSGSRRGSGQNYFTGYAGGSIASVQGSVVLDDQKLPTAANLNNAYFVAESKTYTTSRTYAFNGDGTPVQDYNFTQTLGRDTVPAGLGANRPAVTLTGRIGGILITQATPGGSIISGSALSGTSAITLDPTLNRLQATFSTSGATFISNDPQNPNPAERFVSGDIVFGSNSAATRARSAYVDYDNFGARDGVTVTNAQTGDTVSASKINGATPTFNTSELINVTPALARQLAPALSSNTLNFCNCDLTRWGFWSMEAGRTLNGNTYEDRGHLLLWVAGQLPTMVEMPTTGSATYGGHLIVNAGTFNSNTSSTSSYVAAGNLTANVNFGSRNGTVVVSGLDGGYYTGGLSISTTDPRELSATLTSQSRVLSLNGQFFRGTSGPAGEMGGNASILGTDAAGTPNYAASGIFAASTTTPPAQVTQFAPQAFAMSMSNCCAATATSQAPYLPAAFASGPGTNTLITPLLGYRAGSQDNPAFATTLQYGVNITGSGASQSSWLFVASGGIVNDGNGGSVFSDGFFGSRRGAANQGMGRADGTFSSPAGSVALDGNRLPTSASITNDYYVSESKTYVANPALSFQGDGTPFQNYTFSQTATRVATPAGLGNVRPDVTLTGYTGGLMRTLNSDTSTFIGPSFITTGIASIKLDPNTSRMQANFFVAGATSPTAGAFQSGSFQFGSVDTSQRATGSYVDTDNFGARREVAVTNTQTGATTPVSTVNGAALTNHNAAMVNISRANAQQFANAVGTNVNFCQCDYTRWGFWSNDSQRTSGGTNYADRGNLMTWVAGRAITSAEVPTTGTATYDGHVIASIKNGNNEYVAAGNLTNSVNFGTRTGNVTVTNLDSTNYAGVVQAQAGSANMFAGGLTGDTGGRSLILSGQYFRGVSSPVGEMGGTAILSGSNYIGSGIFAGKMR